MRDHPHVRKYVLERPWAILPGTLEAMLELLELDAAGDRFTPEEVQARIADGPGHGEPQRVSGVAILPIFGAITPRADLFSDVSGGTSLETFRSQLDEAVRSEDVRAIVLDVNSPGGSTEMLEETAAELRAARDVKPVIAVANTLMASAAYHLGAQASELFVTPSGYAGSIGVYTAHDDLSAANEKAGLKTTFIKAGRHKTDGNPFEPLDEEAEAHLQTIVDAAYDVMARDIAAGRRVSEADVRGERFGEGRTFDSRRAVARGMADGVQTFDETVATVLVTGESGRSSTAPAIAALELEHETFSDAVSGALRAVDSVVTDAEALRELTSAKREQLLELRDRLDGLAVAGDAELLEPDAHEEPADAGETAELELEAEALAAEAEARMRLSA